MLIYIVKDRQIICRLWFARFAYYANMWIVAVINAEYKVVGFGCVGYNAHWLCNFNVCFGLWTSGVGCIFPCLVMLFWASLHIMAGVGMVVLCFVVLWVLFDLHYNQIWVSNSLIIYSCVYLILPFDYDLISSLFCSVIISLFIYLCDDSYGARIWCFSFCLAGIIVFGFIGYLF
eukprot:gene3475-2426_t